MLSLLFPKPTLGANPACKKAEEDLTKVVFDAAVANPPVINPQLAEEMRVYAKATLSYQVVLSYWRARCHAARSLGLLECDMKQAGTLLTGKPVTKVQRGRFLEGLVVSFETKDDILAANEHNRPLPPSREAPNAMLPLLHSGGHKLLFGSPKDLRITIPMGRVLCYQQALAIPFSPPDEMKNRSYDGAALNEKLFDQVVILAPEWCWTSPKPRDPAVFAMITGPWNREINQWDHRYFFLGRWE